MKYFKSTVSLLLFGMQIAVAEFTVYQLYGYQGLLLAAGAGILVLMITVTISSLGN